MINSLQFKQGNAPKVIPLLTIKVCFGADSNIRFDCPYIVHIEQKEKNGNVFFLGKKDERTGKQMKAFLILEDGNVFTGTSIGSTREVISEIVFNTPMTGYLEVLTDPSYAGQAVVMTYPLIGNYGITPDMESKKPWPDGYIVRELSRMPSNFRCEGTIQDFLTKNDIPGIAGIDTRALTKI